MLLALSEDVRCVVEITQFQLKDIEQSLKAAQLFLMATLVSVDGPSKTRSQSCNELQ